MSQARLRQVLFLCLYLSASQRRLQLWKQKSADSLFRRFFCPSVVRLPPWTLERKQTKSHRLCVRRPNMLIVPIKFSRWQLGLFHSWGAVVVMAVNVASGFWGPCEAPDTPPLSLHWKVILPFCILSVFLIKENYWIDKIRKIRDKLV